LHWNNLPHEAKIAESLSSFKSIYWNKEWVEICLCVIVQLKSLVFFLLYFVFLVYTPSAPH
jgi:hypothetical protein